MKTKYVVLTIIAVLAILAIAADCLPKIQPVTISSKLSCQPSLYGPTYWMEFPGCSESEKLVIQSDKLPKDCSFEGKTITATGFIGIHNGDYVMRVRELSDCFPLPGADICQ